MYINKIDELIDRIIDDFYVSVMSKKDIDKIRDEINFVRYQKDINNLLIEYFKRIDKNDIMKIVEDEDNTIKVFELLKRYVAYYFFLSIGGTYKGKSETFVNNIIEFTRNQISFNLKINNFFNSESNSNILKYNNLVHDVLKLISLDSARYDLLSKKPEYQEAINLINQYGLDFFKTEIKTADKKLEVHKLVKILIIVELYLNTDKKDVFLILDKKDKDTSEYIFIDVVIPKYEYIDINAIELALSEKDIQDGLASEIYDLLTNVGDNIMKMRQSTHEDKIITLMDSGIITPITDDFLLYHKDTEKYDKFVDKAATNKKKEDTKIKYIVTKIDSASDYYSKNTQENENIKRAVEKNFYSPMSNRGVVIVNNTENDRIITKLNNQGRTAIENNEFYNDLVNYMVYPYVNYRDLRTKGGFNINPNRTVDAVRYINFEEVNKKDLNKDIQLRTASNNLSVNMVGLVIYPFDDVLNCLRVNEFTDVRKLRGKNNTNGYNGAVSYLRKKYSDGNVRDPIYWLFDLDRDLIKLEQYDMQTKLNKSENMKLIVSKLYDEMVGIILNRILNEISKNRDEVKLQDFYNIVREFDRRVFRIDKDSLIFKDLEIIVFREKYLKAKARYDINEDIFHGFGEDTIKLPKVEDKRKGDKLKLRVHHLKEEVVKIGEYLTEADQAGAICQHNITWESITELRKKSPNMFTQLIFEFIQQFVEKNYEDDFICKSCGFQLDLKNYVQDGTYDSDGYFVTFTSVIDTPVEDIKEYEKYKPSIRNLEKIIDRIASISNINTLIGNTSLAKTKVRQLVKSTIDLVLIHNYNLKNVYKKRSETLTERYGIENKLSNLFVFELDNSIFIYSSKDKDYYKPIKRNNILVYVMFLMIIELNDTQMLYMTGDRICSYYVFNTYAMNWFSQLKVVINNKKETEPITKYPALCYLIFYLSCLATKYNMWYRDTEETKTKKFDPMIQKIIINTFVDVLNSILEVYSNKKRNYIYDVISNKFFQKLSSMYKSTTVLDKIKEIEERKSILSKQKKTVISVKVKAIKLQDEFIHGSYFGVSEWRWCGIGKLFTEPKVNIVKRRFEITNMTNCDGFGTFHNWKVKGKSLVCEICGKDYKGVTDDKKLASTIKTTTRKKQLERILGKYCKIGLIKCEKWDKINDDKKESLLKDIHDKIKIIPLNSKESSNDKDSKIISKLDNQSNETIKEQVNNFIKWTETMIGIDPDVGTYKSIKYDIYMIDHNYDGYKINTPIVIKDQGDKINFKASHPFFKEDTLFYTDNKLQTQVFYNSKTLQLLGYKERNKEFQYSKRRDAYIKVFYSTTNKLMMLGYQGKYLRIGEERDKIEKIYEDKQIILKNIVSKIGRDRISNLKRGLGIFQRLVNRIVYSLVPEETDELKEEDKVIQKYLKKLDSIKIEDGKDNKFFRDYDRVINRIFYKLERTKVINLDYKEDFFSYIDVNKYDNNGNKILFYLLDELKKLVMMNEEKSVKVNVIYLIVDIIDYLHSLFNEDTITTNIETRRFEHMLKSADYVKEIQSVGGETQGFYEEYKDPEEEVDSEKLEEEEDTREEMESMDIEDELDYEIDYQPGVNMG